MMKEAATARKNPHACCDNRNRGNREPQTIEVHIREHDQIHKDQKIRDREAGKAEPAPQEKPLLDPDVAPEQQQGTEQGR
jgi:hypothetical protein